jgi:arylsulfatase A-like enzyme
MLRIFSPLLVLLVLIGPAGSPAAAEAGEGDRPNVLLIVSDDHNYRALGAAGNEAIRTPNLDRLAAEGVRFTRCFSPHPICLPSRACILTGQDSWTNGSADFNETPAIEPDAPLWPRLLKEAGYRTFYTGKWHNDGRPSTRGFTDGANIFFGGMDDHRRTPMVDHGEAKSEREPRGVFSSTAFADAAVRFLKERAGQGDRPFALFLSFTAPHDPWVPPEEYARMYRRRDMPVPPNFMPEPPYETQENFPCLPDQRQLGYPRFKWAVRAALTQYYGMITHMDEQIGRVLDALEARGLAEDTLVIFVGDHGYSMGSHGFVGKQTMREEGIRMPLILRYPRLDRGEPTHDALVDLRDLCPTILEAAGISIPESVEGRSLLGYYRGDPEAPERERIFAGFASRLNPSYHRLVTRCIRTHRYKLIRHLLTDETELFDLREDPHELNNLAGDPEYADVQRKLRRQLEDWRSEHRDR